MVRIKRTYDYRVHDFDNLSEEKVLYDEELLYPDDPDFDAKLNRLRSDPTMEEVPTDGSEIYRGINSEGKPWIKSPVGNKKRVIREPTDADPDHDAFNGAYAKVADDYQRKQEEG